MSAERELEEAVNSALVRRGVETRAVVRAGKLELEGSQPPVVIDLGQLLEQWQLLPDMVRAKRVEMLAARLAGARGLREPWRERAPSFPWWAVVGFCVAVGLAAAAYVWLRRTNFFGGSGGTASSGAALPETKDQAAARAARVCDAARASIRAGASMGPFQTDGWEVVLWLARPAALPPLRQAVVDTGAVAGEQLGPIASKGLRAMGEGGVLLLEEDDRRFAQLRVRLSGAYARAFFEQPGRDLLVRWADATAVAVAADLAALYAGCAHVGAHEVGAWYRGKDEARAVAALLFAAGHLGGALREPPGGYTLDALLAAAQRLEPAVARDAIAVAGGVLAAAAGDAGAPGWELRFPAGGPTRAGAAASSIGRGLDDASR